MITIITELRKALSTVTQDDWHFDDNFGLSVTSVSPSGLVIEHVRGSNGENDMRFIALCSPRNINALLERIAELEAQPERQPVADVVAWSHPNSERTCDISWRNLNVEPGPLYTAPQSVLKSRTELAKSLSHGEYKWLDRIPELIPYAAEQMNRPPVVCISGPMTGYKNFNRDEFNAEARAMEDRGYVVLNPAILPEGLQHEQYMSITLAMLRQADAILMLKGWHESKGAQLELDLAIRLGLVVLTESWSAMGEVIKRNPRRNGGHECTQ